MVLMPLVVPIAVVDAKQSDADQSVLQKRLIAEKKETDIRTFAWAKGHSKKPTPLESRRVSYTNADSRQFVLVDGHLIRPLTGAELAVQKAEMQEETTKANQADGYLAKGFLKRARPIYENKLIQDGPPTRWRGFI